MKTAAVVVALVFILTGSAIAQDSARLDQIESRVQAIEGNVKGVERLTKQEASTGGLVLFLFGTVCAIWAQNNGRSGLLWFILGFVFSIITAVFVIVLNSGARAKERKAARSLAAAQAPDPMRAGDITRRSEILAALVLLLFLVLVGAAVNVPIAIALMNAPTPFQGGPEVDLSGAAAPQHWPSATPADEPWPAPNVWQEWWSPGVRRIVVRSVAPPETFSMDIQHYGWPAPVIETNETQRVREGPRSPVWREGAPPQLITFGLVVNPVLYGIALWCVLVLPVLLFFMGRRAWRLRGGRCAWCGHALEGLYRCPECGREAHSRRRVQA